MFRVSSSFFIVFFIRFQLKAEGESTVIAQSCAALRKTSAEYSGYSEPDKTTCFLGFHQAGLLLNWL
jgi:hypothetical protein